MLKVGGIWVSPAEIEHLLLEHPAVQACGVTGREDHDGLIKPVAHVVLRRRRTNRVPSSWRQLQQFARQRLAEYKRPRWIEFVDALPTDRDRQSSAFQAAIAHAFRQLNGCLKSIPARIHRDGEWRPLGGGETMLRRNPTRAAAMAVSMTGGTRAFADWIGSD